MSMVTLLKFYEITGYTPDECRGYIKRGQWKEGDVWEKAPNGKIHIITEGYEQWVQSERLQREASG